MRATERNRLFLAVLFSLFAHITAFVLLLLLPLLAAWQAGKALLEDENRNLRIALLLALMLHIAVMVPLANLLISMQDNDADKNFLQVDLLNMEPQPDDVPDTALDKQTVRTPPLKDKRAPREETRFVSKHDSRAEEETVARLPLPGMVEGVPSPAAEGDGREMENKPASMRKENMVVGPPLPPGIERSDRRSPPVTGTTPPDLGDINLTPSEGVLASALKGTGLDHLEGVIDGDLTALNAMGWDFAPFFNRTKQQVERYWHPDREYRLRDPYGNIYGYKDRETVLLVVLEHDGSLKNIYVISPSGASFLDDEAVEAVQQGAPFPNVPEGLVDKQDGLVKFTFHFIVEVGNAPVFRMRRY